MQTNYKDWLISWDNDGTISDSKPLWDEIHATTAKHFGLYYETGLGTKMYLREAPLVWKQFKSLEEQYKFYMEEYEPMSIAMSKMPEWIDRIQLFPGMKDVLVKLNKMGLQMGVVTSSSSIRARAPLTKNGAIYLMKDIVSCEDLKLKDKPSTESIQVLSSNLSIRPDRIIHIGDLKYDIQMAHNFGCFSIGCGYGKYCTPEQTKAENPTAMVRMVQEIKSIPTIIERLIKHNAR